MGFQNFHIEFKAMTNIKKMTIVLRFTWLPGVVIGSLKRIFHMCYHLTLICVEVAVIHKGHDHSHMQKLGSKKLR
jgi:hypothetical protein